ncbi:KsdD-like steroid dehydrogenase [Nymphon striatum]|nr:KsdD-like steroid dehydrogenase [Nymphon striatum]
MIAGVPHHVDGRMIGIAKKAGANAINEDRMWHYTEGVKNFDPIWPSHGIRILPGPSSMWFDAEGNRMPAPCLPGFDTLGTLKHILSTGYDYSWFVLTQKIIEKEFALSGSEQNPDLTSKKWMEVIKARLGKGGYSQAVAVSGHQRTVYISGQIPVQKDGTVPATFTEQAEQAWANIEAQLEEAGMGIGNIIRHTTELKQRYGEEEAISVMRCASREHGIEVGKSLAHLAPNDFTGLVEEYFKGPDDGATFNPEIKVLTESCLDVHVQTCPLKDGWLDAGCSNEEVCTLLKCATAFDEAVWEASGFDYEMEVWTPGKTGCCRTIVTAKS